MAIKVAKFGFSTLVASGTQPSGSKGSSELCVIERFWTSLKDGVAPCLAWRCLVLSRIGFVILPDIQSAEEIVGMWVLGGCFVVWVFFSPCTTCLFCMQSGRINKSPRQIY